MPIIIIIMSTHTIHDMYNGTLMSHVFYLEIVTVAKSTPPVLHTER